MSEKTKKILRYIIGFISILVIIFMWTDINLSNYTREDAIPIIVTSIAISFVKALMISSVIILVKIVIKKMNKKNKG